MNPDDIIRVTFFFTYLGQQCLNVFFYRAGADTPANQPMYEVAPDLAQQFIDNVLTYLSDQLTLDTMFMENLTDGVTIYQQPVNVTGDTGSDPLPSSVALGVIQRRATKITRNGYKRFVGLTELQVAGNIVNITGTPKDNIESFCEGNLVIDLTPFGGTSMQLRGVIVGRTKNAQGVYEIDLAKINDIGQAQLRNTASTQNTRKP